MPQKTSSKNPNKVPLIIAASAALVGLIASFALSVEKLHLLENPDAQLSCSFNVVFNCASVMQTDQASFFWGVPNSFFGMLGFPVVLALLVSMIYGASLPRWIVSSLYAGSIAAWVSALVLFFDSVYVIRVLCPWCLLVTSSTTVLVAAVTRYYWRSSTGRAGTIIRGLLDKQYDVLIFSAIAVLLVALGIIQFGDSF